MEGSITSQPSPLSIANSNAVSRRAFEIPKPRDWQHFQSACTVLFGQFLGDPTATQYGRAGQAQSGIDILIRKPDGQYVGVQCRRVQDPIRFAEMRRDCNATLELPFDLYELIFATTAPDDTASTNDAKRLEQELRGQGRNLRVTVIGWDALQDLVARYPAAHEMFSVGPTPDPSDQSPEPITNTLLSPEFIDKLARGLAAKLGGSTLAVATEIDEDKASKSGSAERKAEDFALHGKIDAIRDLLRAGHSKAARVSMKQILDNENFSKAPYARFRALTNYASAEFHCGNERIAADYYEQAFRLRPEEPKAAANMALVSLIRDLPQQALDYAKSVPESSEDAEYAYHYALQAQSTSGGLANPESAIPEKLKGRLLIDLGLAEFHRRSETPGWPVTCFAIAKKHAFDTKFDHIVALAALAQAIEGEQKTREAEDDLRPYLLKAAEFFETSSRELQAEEREDNGALLRAHLNNGALAWRLLGHPDQSLRLLNSFKGVVRSDASLVRLLSLTLVELDEIDEAEELLSHSEDDESKLFFADLLSRRDVEGAIRIACSVNPSNLKSQQRISRAVLLGELGAKAADESAHDEAVDELSALSPPLAEVAQIQWQDSNGAGREAANGRLEDLIAKLDDDLDIGVRVLVAQQARRQKLIQPVVEVLRPVAAHSTDPNLREFWLKALAAARRDEEFRTALDKTPAAIKERLDVIWCSAFHAWNCGDLDQALLDVNKVLEKEPGNPEALLFKAEILIRNDRTSDLLALLSALEIEPSFKKLKDKIRFFAILAHFGFDDRALHGAYKIVLQEPKSPLVWELFANLLLLPRPGGKPKVYDMETVQTDAWVNIEDDEGSTFAFIVEADPDILKIDGDSFPQQAAIVQETIGKAPGADVGLPNGQRGKILEVKHKYVALLHKIFAEYNLRFPSSRAFKKVKFDPSSEGGMVEFEAMLKKRAEFAATEVTRFYEGRHPIAILSLRLGVDVWDTLEALRSDFTGYECCNGNAAERAKAEDSLRKNQRHGCVVDIVALKAIWKLKLGEVVQALCGKIAVSRETIDEISGRIEALAREEHDGRRSVAFVDGRMVMSEVSAAQLIAERKDCEELLSWLKSTAEILPLKLTNTTPAAIRDLMLTPWAPSLSSGVIAACEGRLFLTDDARARHLAGCELAAWTNVIVTEAINVGLLSRAEFVTATLGLLDLGQRYIGVSARLLFTALMMDVKEGDKSHSRYTKLVTRIGGKLAELESHIGVCVDFLRALWTPTTLSHVREKATGKILERIIFEQPDRLYEILATIQLEFLDNHFFVEYFRGWCSGHFVDGRRIVRMVQTYLEKNEASIRELQSDKQNAQPTGKRQ